MRKKKINRKKSYIFSDYYSKIKKVYLELHDFSFFHGPSGMNEVDNRFIGRKLLVQKLKALLLNGKTKSGAYLVTGYRGMGKSSLIGKVAQEITVGNKLPNILNRIISDITYTVIFLFILKWLLQAYMDPRDVLFINLIPIVGLLLSILCYVLYKIESIKTYIFFHIRLSVVLYSFLLLKNFCPLLILLMSLPIIVNVLQLIFELKVLKKFDQFTVKEFKEFIEKCISTFFLKLEFWRRIIIKINLGHENLKEKDILGLIARSVYTHYSDYRRSFVRGLPFKLLTWISIFTVLFILFQNKDIVDINNAFKNEIGLYRYFPSQENAFNENKKAFKNIINDLNERNLLSHTFIKEGIIYKYHYAEYSEFLNSKKNNGIINKIFNFFNKITVHFDLIYFDIYYKITGGNYNFLNDYLFVIYFLFANFFLQQIKKIKYFRTSSYSLLRRLKNFDAEINSQVTVEERFRLGGRNHILGLNSNRGRTRPPMNVNEIEQSLIEIIEGITNAHWWDYRADFIFVIDELDKIEPQNRREFNEAVEKGYIPKQNTLFEPDMMRDRINLVFNLLSNLKYFLSTAQAKFIFIAGREMYDASLADVSDRDYFIRSIFNDVIYVESFLSDISDNRSTDITSMTEWYVCQFLIPENNLEKDSDKWMDRINEIKNLNTQKHSKVKNRKYPPNLYGYNSWLMENIPELSKEKNGIQKREKIIITLKHFITYLTHSSNGAPNRLKSNYERFIVYKKVNQNYNSLVVNKKKGRRKSFYLYFGFYDQYHIGFANYLISPVHLAISNMVRDYGDKILISASFLIDRLFKFHAVGFSWRYLELTPEIIDVNKTPELRKFISKLIEYLTKTQIRENINTLFSFRYPKRISQEISLLSKISDEAAAAFNFTLDETQAIKKIYLNRLDELIERNKNFQYPGNNKFVHTVSATYAILGDLYYISDEFNEAITYYKESIQYLRYMPEEDMFPEHLILFIRNMLKLGLCFEKRNTYDPAFLTYGQITAILIRERNIDLKKYGLQLKKDKENKFVFTKNEKKKKKTDSYEEHIKPPQIDSKQEGFFRSTELMTKLTEFLTPEKAYELYKLTTFESLRVIYQSILAKFQIIEKGNIGGITYSDIKRLKSEFYFLTRTVNNREKYIIISEFWNKVATILYYKNGIVLKTEELDNIKKHYEKSTFKTGFEPFCKCKNNFKSYSNPKKAKVRNTLNLKYPCSACKYYFKSFAEFLSKFDKSYQVEAKQLPPKFIFKSLEIYHKRSFSSTRSDFMKNLANIIADIGDVFISCAGKNEKLNSEFLVDFFDLIRYDNIGSFLTKYETKDKNNIYDVNLNKLEEALLYFYTSGRYYKLADEYKEYAYQYTKIVLFLREYVSADSNRKIEITPFLERIKDDLIPRANAAIYNAYNNIHTIEILKLKKDFSYDEKHIHSGVSINKVSIYPDLAELNINFNDLDLLCIHDDVKNEKLKIHFKQSRLSAFGINDNFYNRILHLSYIAHVNYKVFSKFGFSDFFDPLFGIKTIYQFLDILNNPNKFDSVIDIVDLECSIEEFKNKPKLEKIRVLLNVFSYLISDTISIYSNVIRHIGILGHSFGITHTFEASIRMKLAFWTEIFIHFKYILSIFDLKSVNNNKALDELKTELLKNNFNRINSWNEREKKKFIHRKNGIPKLKVNSVSIPELEEYPEFAKTWEELEGDKNFSPPKFLKKLKNSYTYYKKIIETLDCLNGEIQSINTLFEEQTLDKHLKDLLGEDFFEYMETKFQIGKAKVEFYESLDTHSEGKAYKNLINEMYYLNDDFNDKYYHFSIALERYRHGTKKFRKSFEKVKDSMFNTTVFKHDVYNNKSN